LVVSVVLPDQAQPAIAQIVLSLFLISREAKSSSWAVVVMIAFILQVNMAAIRFAVNHMVIIGLLPNWTAVHPDCLCPRNGGWHETGRDYGVEFAVYIEPVIAKLELPVRSAVAENHSHSLADPSCLCCSRGDSKAHPRGNWNTGRVATSDCLDWRSRFADLALQVWWVRTRQWDEPPRLRLLPWV
jgi:hypothetical protein